MSLNIKIHPTAEVSEKSKIGDNTKIWNNSQVREYAEIGENCILGKNVYVDTQVTIGKNCKIQNNVSIFHGVTIKDDVFVGPHVCFVNVDTPAAVNFEGKQRSVQDYEKEIKETLVKQGVKIGARSVIRCGITIGEYAFIGMGSVITKDVRKNELVYGNPAKLRGFVCKCGIKMNLEDILEESSSLILKCPQHDYTIKVGGELKYLFE